MPTTLERTTITHVPRVQRLIDQGRQLWPEKSAKDVLVELAERGLATTVDRGVRGLVLFAGPPSGLSAAEVEEALLDD